MKTLKIVFTLFCSLIMIAAAVNILGDDSREYVKNITAVLFIGATIIGVVLKNKKAMLGFPMYALIVFGIEFGSDKKLASILGGLSGISLILIMWYFVYRSLSIQAPDKKDVL